MANFNIDYLVVAGGGGGARSAFSSTTGGAYGGGGGAGEYLYKTAQTITTGGSGYTVTVGDGGNAGTSGVSAANGGNSVFIDTTLGGGYGGTSNNSTYSPGGSGGSGGGSGINTSTVYAGGSSTATSPGLGNAGGASTSTVSTSGAGGGGGAGTAGSNGTSSTGGNGGTGVQNSITSTATFYAGGGGGGSFDNNNVGSGGSGVGGNANARAAGSPGTSNTGSGGGGGSYSGSAHTDGAAGGSGIVILRYATSDVASYTTTGITPTEDTTTISGQTILSFTTVGTGTIIFTAPATPITPFDGTRATTPVTGFNKTGTGEGLKLPSGDNSNQPVGALAEQGMIRNDTEETVDSSDSAIAHYNGSDWQYFAATESPDSPPASPAPTQLDSTIPNFSYSANTAGRPNCRIVSSTTGYYSTRTSTGFTSGKFYCEMKFLSSSAYASGRCGPGVGNNSMNLNSYMGTDANSAGLLTKPEMFLYNGSYTGSPGSGSYSTNGIIMMAFDADTRTFFMGYNGTWSTLTGDPITGAGSVLPADVSPFYWGGWGYNGSDSIEFNFYGSDMAYTIPQGYITA